MSQHPNTTAIQPGGNAVIPALRRASAATGVDFNFLLEQARTESSLNPAAQARTSSARGLFQFIDSTWLELIDKYGAKYGLDSQASAICRDAKGCPVVNDPAQRAAILRLRDDPYLSGVMAGELARDNAASLQQQLGREAKPGELYMAHFLGAGGAARFLDRLERNPDLNASHVLPAAARANEAVFFKGGRALSLDEVYARFEGKFSTNPAMMANAGSIAGSAATTAPAAVAATAPARTSLPPQTAGAGMLAAGFPTMGTGAAAMPSPNAAMLALHATRLAAAATLKLGSEPTPGDDAADMAADEMAWAQNLASALSDAERAASRDSATTSLTAADGGAALRNTPDNAGLYALHVLQSLSLPGSEDSPQTRRWRV